MSRPDLPAVPPDGAGVSGGKFHGYIEVTVVAALIQEDGTFLNNDMADVTLAFGIPTKQPPRALTEAESQASIRSNLSRIAAMVESVFLVNGAQHLGQVLDPIIDHGREVGHVRMDPVRVHIVPVEEHVS